METHCIACHAPQGLHTADCRRAFRAAYDKALGEAEEVLHRIAEQHGRDGKHSYSSVAEDCASRVRQLTGGCR